MPKRPSKCYRAMNRPNTRREFVSHYPNLPEGLKKFSYGNTSKFDFPAKITLINLMDIQISALALESVRVTINRELKLLGDENYRLEIKSIPHHVTRMHGLVGVAKAERLAKGMRGSFGRSMSRFARIKKGKPLIEILIKDEPVPYGICKKALTTAIKKLPSKWKIVTEGISLVNLSAKVKLPKRAKESATGGRTVVPREL